MTDDKNNTNSGITTPPQTTVQPAVATASVSAPPTQQAQPPQTPIQTPTNIVSDSVNAPQNITPVTSVITSPHAPQKYGGKKILATIFGLLLIVGGVVSGVALVQRQQNISEQAQTADYDAQCSVVKAYDANWNELSTTDLFALTPGTVVRLTVSGITSGGSFDKARFTINGTQTPEVTVKKPDSEEFYYEYTIPEGVTNFTIKAEVHHTIWGWI